MKKIILTALGVSLLMSGITSVGAEGKYTAPSQETVAAKQSESTKMRVDYYNQYKAKGYDMAPLVDYLDASKTSDSEFWAAFKVIKDKKEVPERRAYVEKLKSYGYDVSGFTEEIIWDSGKFWEMYKAVEAGKKLEVKNETEKKVEVKKEEYKKEEYKKEEYKKPTEMKKEEVKAKLEEKKDEVKQKVSQSQNDRLKALMKARIAKLPADSRDATLVRLESTLTKAIESARAKNSKVLIARYEVLLSVVREEMNNVDDETLINSLFQ